MTPDDPLSNRRFGAIIADGAARGALCTRCAAALVLPLLSLPIDAAAAQLRTSRRVVAMLSRRGLLRQVGLLQFAAVDVHRLAARPGAGGSFRALPADPTPPTKPRRRRIATGTAGCGTANPSSRRAAAAARRGAVRVTIEH